MIPLNLAIGVTSFIYIFDIFLLPVLMKVFENSKFFKNRSFFLSTDS